MSMKMANVTNRSDLTRYAIQCLPPGSVVEVRMSDGSWTLCRVDTSAPGAFPVTVLADSKQPVGDRPNRGISDEQAGRTHGFAWLTDLIEDSASVTVLERQPDAEPADARADIDKPLTEARVSAIIRTWRARYGIPFGSEPLKDIVRRLTGRGAPLAPADPEPTTLAEDWYAVVDAWAGANNGVGRRDALQNLVKRIEANL